MGKQKKLVSVFGLVTAAYTTVQTPDTPKCVKVSVPKLQSDLQAEPKHLHTP